MEQLLRVIQPVFKLSLAAQCLGGESGDNLVSRVGDVFTHKADFVDLDPSIAFERVAQLVDQRFGAAGGSTGGEGADKLGQAGLRTARGEMDTGDSGIGEQARKAAFRRRRLQRHAIDVQLRARGPEQQPGFAGYFQRVAQLVPGGLKLRGGALMPELVQAGKLQQDV